MKPVNIAMIVVFGLLTVAATVLTVYGITHHTEAGLMEVCWEGTHANYAPCATASELTWEREAMPLEVTGPQDEALTESISILNSNIGCTVFVYNSARTESTDVTVSLDSPVEVGDDVAGGATSHFRNGTRMSATVATMLVTDPQMKLRVLTHELGHVLGLAHDDFEGSIMFPSQSSEGFIRLSDSDRTTLNELYCP